MESDGTTTDAYFLLPDCFYDNLLSISSISLSNVIVNGSTSIGDGDPLLRFRTVTSSLFFENVRLINPLTNYAAGSNYPYTINWSAIETRYQGLSELGLINANVQGSLPSALPPTLVILDVSQNALTGPVTYLFANLSVSYSGVTLAMNVSHNALTGTVPSDYLSFFTSAISYCTVDLSFNSLTGSVSTGFFSPLENAAGRQLSVYLNGNKLSGTIPTPLISRGSQSTIIISLANNSLTGSISSGLLSSEFSAGYLTLDLSANKLSGSIPAALLSNAASTYNIQLSAANNTLTGSVPDFWSSLTATSTQQYFTFDFSGNQLSGSIPDGILAPLYSSNKSENIYGISWNLASNRLSGPISRSVANVTGQLNSFSANLNNNALTGTLPANLLVGANVAYFSLFLASNNLTGTIPATTFASLPSMSTLEYDVSNNALSGSISPSFAAPVTEYQFVSDWYFGASNCGLSGSIPSNLRFKSARATIHLDNNNLNGTFPSSSLFIETSTEKKRTDYSGNLIFTASNNKLTGSLNISAVNNLDYYPFAIDLSHNLLTSLIVETPTILIAVAVDVSYNPKLTGTVPSNWFVDSSQVTYFSAASTLLNGPFPRVNNTDAGDHPLKTLDLSNTLVSFCNGTASNGYNSTNQWNSTRMTSCDLHQTSAHLCASYYPSVCNTKFTTSPTSDASTSFTFYAALPLIAALMSAAMLMM